MAELKIYEGSCHCGKVRFTAKLDLSKPVVSCNCSMCRRAGTLLTFVPASDFTLLFGEDSLTSYKFNHHVIDHLFCKTCGIKAFARGKDPSGADVIAVNARSIDEVDPKSLTIYEFDGKSV